MLLGENQLRLGSIINFSKDNCFVPLRLSNRKESAELVALTTNVSKPVRPGFDVKKAFEC